MPSQGVRILVATKPVDFRKGDDGLAALVQSALAEDPFTGTVFVFRANRADRMKILFWDGSGLVMPYKRLEEATFTWPAIRDGAMTLTFLDDRRVEIDSNDVENLIRPIPWTRTRFSPAMMKAAALRAVSLRSSPQRKSMAPSPSPTSRPSLQVTLPACLTNSSPGTSSSQADRKPPGAAV